MKRLMPVLVLGIMLLLGACGQKPPPKAPESGVLSITVAGLPPGVGANIQVTGPDGYEETVTASGSLRDLVHGVYAVTPANVVHAGGSYEAPASSVTVTEAEESVTVSYVVRPGKLAVAIAGQAPGVDANVLVSGPGGYSETLSASSTLENLVPGEYAVVGLRSGVFTDARVSDDSFVVQVVSDEAAAGSISYRPQTVMFYTDSDGAYGASELMALLTADSFKVTRFLEKNKDQADDALLSTDDVFDLAIWLVVGNSTNKPKEPAVAAHLDAGGRFLYFDWSKDLDDDDVVGISALLNSSFTGNKNSLVVDVPDARLNAGMTLPLTLDDSVLFLVYTTGLVPEAGGSSLCVFTVTDESCAVLGNAGRSLHVGFTLHSAPGSSDGELFFKNAIELLLSN